MERGIGGSEDRVGQGEDRESIGRHCVAMECIDTCRKRKVSTVGDERG